MTKLRAAAIAVLLGFLLLALFVTRPAEAPRTASEPAAPDTTSSTPSPEVSNSTPDGDMRIPSPRTIPDDPAEDELVFISITVRDRSESGIGNARVSLVGAGTYTGETNAKGEFQTNAPPGDYKIEVTHSKYATLNDALEVDGSTSKSIQLKYLTISGTVSGRGEHIQVDPFRAGLVTAEAQHKWKDELRFVDTQGRFEIP